MNVAGKITHDVMPSRVEPLIEECDFLIEHTRALVVVRGPILDVGAGANNVEIPSNDGPEDARLPLRGLGKEFSHALTNARQMRHLRVLLGGIFFTRVEVGGNDAYASCCGFNDCFKPTSGIDVAFLVVKKEARFTADVCAILAHRNCDTCTSLNAARKNDAFP